MSVERVSLRVSPDPTLRVAEAELLPSRPLLDPAGPTVILGGLREPQFAPMAIAPSPNTLFGPRGACLVNVEGPLWVADTGHHRLLGWRSCPTQDNAPADWVIGQPDFTSEGRNAKGEPGPSSLNVPTGICSDGTHLMVADAWNHRVLIWRSLPTRHDQPADIVLGQDDFFQDEANRGSRATTAADRFHWPYGVLLHDGKLMVADSENRRVLIWNEIPAHSGRPADTVLGQPDFTRRDENVGTHPSAMSMRWPHAIAVWSGHLCVADAGNNRIMVWKGIPEESGAPCDFVLGQTDCDRVDHNQSLYWPRANTVNMPYGVSAVGEWLLVADTANSRLLGWHIDDLATGANARALTGQMTFHDKGDNRWQPLVADSLCWPYGLQVLGDRAVVADSGNNRVLLWRIGP
jgi:NHL repeat